MSRSGTALAERPRVTLDEADGLDWSILSSHGKVVLFLALCPEATIQQIARALDRTERAVARTVASLRRSGIVRARTVHRRKLFSVNLDASLFHPTLTGYTLRQVFGNLREYVRRTGVNVCEDGIPQQDRSRNDT
jgi:DNA-binding transcriptional ArsR family regulator